LSRVSRGMIDYSNIVGDVRSDVQFVLEKVAAFTQDIHQQLLSSSSFMANTIPQYCDGFLHGAYEEAKVSVSVMFVDAYAYV